MGAAGRDFHNFNVFFRNNPRYEVVCFTATQIPGIENRQYPPELSGDLYPNGIPILDEASLSEVIRDKKIDEVVLAYSDLLHEDVMHRASRVLAAGADFTLMGTNSTMLKSVKPVISICAARTGAGKSPTTRRIVKILRQKGLRTVAIRHPMPYGDLRKQVLQRFASLEDLDKNECTIEEREEYEPHIELGSIIYAGVDYEMILRAAEKEADVIIWDGGNNDLPFYQPNVAIVVVDPHRPGHESTSYPGEANVLLADIVSINKVDSADPKDVEKVEHNVRELNPKAIVVKTESPITVDNPDLVRGKRVLAIEDGPTLTHGGMKFGAAYIISQRLGASEIVDPRAYAVGSIKDVYRRFRNLERAILPAMGYGKKQVEELQETINNVPCDTVVIGTPVDLRRVMKVNKPAVKVEYEVKEITHPDFEEILFTTLKDKWLKQPSPP